MTNTTPMLTEKQILQDSLVSQKSITGAYNMFAGECVSEQLRCAMLNILDEEHKIQSDIFNTMHTNGWYPVEQADQQKIQQARQKLSSEQ